MSIGRTIALALGATLILALALYLRAVWRETDTVDAFCTEMREGLDIHKIRDIAAKYDLPDRTLRNLSRAGANSLSVKDTKRENTWFFVVAAPLTIGEHSCIVYHNNLVVISSSSRP